MKRKTKAKAMTLREILAITTFDGDVELINECNETLLSLTYLDNNVCSLDKLLSDNLLDRTVLGVEKFPGFISFRLEGVEDAE